jgi:hypothetical protein
VRDESRGDVARAALHYDDAFRLDRAFVRSREARARVVGQASGAAPSRAAAAARGRGAARLSATTLANGAINGSPVSTLQTSMDAMMMSEMTGMMGMMNAMDGTSATTAQAQGSIQGRAVAGQAQAAFATVVIRLRTVP